MKMSAVFADFACSMLYVVDVVSILYVYSLPFVIEKFPVGCMIPRFSLLSKLSNY